MQHLFDGPPFLSELEVGLILDMEPKCPICNTVARFVYLYTESKHELWREVDGSPSPTMPMRDRLLIYAHEQAEESERYQPHGTDYIRLECDNFHEWTDNKLVFDEYQLRFRDA